MHNSQAWLVKQKGLRKSLLINGSLFNQQNLSRQIC